MPRERVTPNIAHPAMPAAAMVITFGSPEMVNPMWRQLAPEAREVFDCKLVLVHATDFYPPYGGFGRQK